MEQDKKNRLIKNIGLIVLTIVVMVAIFLTVYFVDKHVEDKEAENTYVGYGNATDFGSFTVTGRNLEKSIAGISAKEDHVFFVINIDVNAKEKDVTIKRSQFNFSGYKAKKIDGYLDKNLKLKKGESGSIKLAYEVPISNNELFLYCFNYRVKMGNSIEYVPIG